MDLVSKNRTLRALAIMAISAGCAFAATETLFSNWAFSVAPGGSNGSLLVFPAGK